MPHTDYLLERDLSLVPSKGQTLSGRTEVDPGQNHVASMLTVEKSGWLRATAWDLISCFVLQVLSLAPSGPVFLPSCKVHILFTSNTSPFSSAGWVLLVICWFCCIYCLAARQHFCVIHCHCGCCYRVNIVAYTPQESRFSQTSVLNHPLSLGCPSWAHDRGGSNKHLFLILQLCLIIHSY